VDDATQQRVITLVAAGIAYLISHQVTERYIDIPEQRGVKDDILEAVLKGATTATSTILASILVRRLFRGR
jgi:alcohol dehydrogenase YqhD (iron-dependent ADH family)